MQGHHELMMPPPSDLPPALKTMQRGVSGSVTLALFPGQQWALLALALGLLAFLIKAPLGE